MTGDPDPRFMERALALGERGRGRTTPNPSVGAVVVDARGVIAGQGTTMAAGGAHAEVVALGQAGPAARGATLYCTLEPCAHTGRTGPCVERIVRAGIRRVVVPIEDPNPLVAGQGFAYLRAHGVVVDVGEGASDARRHHAPFITWVTHGRSFVLAKMAVSADGFVGRVGRRVHLTGRPADRFFQRQRAEVDAIAVGAGTVLIDDPLLTSREAYRCRPLTRVLVDWAGRVPASARVFSTLDDGPVIMVVLAEVMARQPAHFAALADRGVIIDPYQARDLCAVVERLALRDVVMLLVEGGPRLHQALDAAGLVDRWQIATTPAVLGEGVPAAKPSLIASSRGVWLGRDHVMEIDVHGTD